MTFLRRIADNLFIIYEDDSIQEKSKKLSLRWTCIVWIFLCIAGFFWNSKPKQPEFTEIKITLNSSPEIPKVEKAPQIQKEEAKTDIPVKKAEPIPENKKQTSPIQKSVPQKVEETQPKKAKVEEPKYTISKPQTFAKSNEDLLAEQLSSSKKEKTWDDSQFGSESETFSSNNTTTSPTVKKIDVSESVRGTAGSATSSVSASASAKTARSNEGSESSSGDTKNALAAIGAVTPVPYSSGSVNGTSSTSLISTSTTKTGVSIAMTNGTVRQLLDPAKPIITLSEASAALIEASRTVTISFKVLPAGNVPLAGIQITPSSSLAVQVQSEIRAQISRWRFASDPSESTATFEYSIIKN